MGQKFLIKHGENERWASGAEMQKITLERQKLERLKQEAKEESAKSPQEPVKEPVETEKKVYTEVEILETRKVFLEKVGSEVPPNMKNNVEWMLNKISII